jgi:CRISPR/Cas system-associated endoribonuclease Cas2
MDYIIVYSIKNNSNRAKIKRILEKVGYKIMRSTYTANLRSHQVKKLFNKISEITGEGDDVLFLRQCAGCRNKARMRVSKTYKNFYFF